MDSIGRPVVLLVEDEPLVRSIAAEQLADRGFVALEAAQAAEALALLAGDGGVDVLFTDIDMPGCMNGVALSRHVRQCYPRVSLIVTSGKGLPPDATLPQGCAFVGKPYVFGKIAALIVKLIAARDQAGG